MTKRQRQSLLNNFVKIVNGKGRSMNGTVCRYVNPNGHPGCAIGCQPKLAKLKTQLSYCEGSTIDQVFIPSCSFVHKQLAEALNVRKRKSKEQDVHNFYNACDVSFLRELQKLHDYESNWQGKDKLKLKTRELTKFCNQWNLNVPTTKK